MVKPMHDKTPTSPNTHPFNHWLRLLIPLLVLIPSLVLAEARVESMTGNTDKISISRNFERIPAQPLMPLKKADWVYVEDKDSSITLRLDDGTTKVIDADSSPYQVMPTDDQATLIKNLEKLLKIYLETSEQLAISATSRGSADLMLAATNQNNIVSGSYKKLNVYWQTSAELVLKDAKGTNLLSDQKTRPEITEIDISEWKIGETYTMLLAQMDDPIQARITLVDKNKLPKDAHTIQNMDLAEDKRFTYLAVALAEYPQWLMHALNLISGDEHAKLRQGIINNAIEKGIIQ